VENTVQSKLHGEVDGILKTEVPIFRFHPPVETNLLVHRISLLDVTLEKEESQEIAFL